MKFFWVGPGLSIIQRLEAEGNTVRWYRAEQYGFGVAPIARRLHPELDEIVVITQTYGTSIGQVLRDRGYTVLGGHQFMDAITNEQYANTLFDSLGVLANPTMIGGWFDGTDWIPGSIHTTVEEWEFLTGDLGPIVDEPMGSTGFFYKNPKPWLLEGTLSKLTPVLRQLKFVGPFGILDGRPYVPMVDVLLRLLTTEYGKFLSDLAHGQLTRFEVCYDFAIGVRLTIPPFPHTGLGLSGPIKMPIETWESFHCALVNRDDEGQIISGGPVLGTMTATASSVGLARRMVYDRVRSVQFPALQYRTDIGARAQREIPRLLKEVADGHNQSNSDDARERLSPDIVDTRHGE